MGQSPNLRPFDPFAPDPWNEPGPVPMRPLTEEERAALRMRNPEWSETIAPSSGACPGPIPPRPLTEFEQAVENARMRGGFIPEAPAQPADLLSPEGQALYNELTHREIELLVGTIAKLRQRIEVLELRMGATAERVDLVEQHAGVTGSAVIGIRRRVEAIERKGIGK